MGNRTNNAMSTADSSEAAFKWIPALIVFFGMLAFGPKGSGPLGSLISFFQPTWVKAEKSKESSTPLAFLTKS